MSDRRVLGGLQVRLGMMNEEPELDAEWLRGALAVNDTAMRRGTLDGGLALAAERTAVYDQTVADWAGRLGRRSGHDGSFAVVALGGTGRQEVCPCSDFDYAVLFDGILEAHPLLDEIRRQTIDTGEFERRHGFPLHACHFDLESVTSFDDLRDLNSFLDLRPVHDPGGLAPRFRVRIAETFDPFQHFLHLRSFWTSRWERAAEQAERLDRFDIKNDGLRVFLAAVWLLGGKDFRHSHEVYSTLDPQVMEAYAFLLRVRQFIHFRFRDAGRRRTPLPDGRHAEDVLGFDDFVSFGDMLEGDADDERRFVFSNEVRARLLAARRQVAVFAKGVIGQELRIGRTVAAGSPHVFGAGGLRSISPGTDATGHDKSRIALALLVAAQRYDLPIDPCELQEVFQGAGDWLEPVPELGDLLHERGSLARSFAFLAQLPGAEERLFPGYGRFEASLDARVMTERKSLRGALANAKIHALENWVTEGRRRLDEAFSEARLKDLNREEVSVAIEAAQLDTEQLAAIKLALKTKRLPSTPDDAAIRGNATLPVHERFASGFSEIPIDDYYGHYEESGSLPGAVLGLTLFLIRERRTFRRLAEDGMAEDRLAATLVTRCGDEHRLRSLFVFTSADHCEWESEPENPALWFSIRELYDKAMAAFRPQSAAGIPFRGIGLTEEDLAVLRDFGADLAGGSYRRHIPHFASHLLRLASDATHNEPKVAIIRDGSSLILGVACRDFRGLAAIITDCLLAEGIGLTQAHLFSASGYSLALDFFHLDRHTGAGITAELPARVAEAIRRHAFFDAAATPQSPSAVADAEWSIEAWREGLFCLRVACRQCQPGKVIHALVQAVYRDLRGNVHALKANSARGQTFVSIYHSMPDEVSPEEARRVLERL